MDLASRHPSGLTPQQLSESTQRFREAFGRRVRERRQQLRLTQMQLAERMGVHRQTIAKYEAGAIVASGSALPALFAALETDEREFWGTESPVAPVPLQQSAVPYRSGTSLPRELRAMALRFLAEANDAGADEAFLRYAKHSLEDPELAEMYAGGLDEDGRPMTAEEQRDDYEALIDALRLIMQRRLARAKKT